MIPIRTSVEVGEIPGTVVGLIVANLAVFLVQDGLPADMAKQFILHNALVPARYTDPGLARELGLDPHNYLPLLTSSFMHVGWAHLVVNMWTLWLFGRALEERLGTLRFILLYLACGLIASLTHFAFNLDSSVPALGASGAIAGVVGGYTLVYPLARIAVLTPVLFFPIVFHLPAAVYTALWFAFQFVSGMAELAAPDDTGGIAWWAHIGGFVAGLALVRLIGSKRHRTREIGAPRVGVREIGVARPRVVKVGAGPEVIPTVASHGHRADRLAGMARRLLPVTPGAGQPADASEAPVAAASGEQRRPWPSQRRRRRTGRSIVPES